MNAFSSDVQGLNLSWIVRLRWWSLATQAVLIGAGHWWLDLQLPLLSLTVIVAIGIASNVALHVWSRRVTPSEGAVFAIIGADLILLSALLYFTGGPFNPFSAAYLVQVVLAVIVLRPLLAWMVTALAVALFGALFPWHVPLPPSPPPAAQSADSADSAPATPETEPSDKAATDHSMHHHMYHQAASAEATPAPAAAVHAGHADHAAMSHEDMMMGHLYGMWLAFGLTAAFIVYFVYQIRGALALRDEELAMARERSVRTEKLVALGTLSAGAAHELATPLSTIAVVAKELERSLGPETDANTREDVELIRSQVERCREILNHMSASAGDTQGEPMARLGLHELLERVTGPFAAELASGRLRWEADEATVDAPRSALTRAVRSLVKNALLSSPTATTTVDARRDDTLIVLRVCDDGPGMPPAVLERATEPFFTTRAPGDGMGLGLFLARAVAESLGGSLTLESHEGRGTTAVLQIPSRQILES